MSEVSATMPARPDINRHPAALAFDHQTARASKSARSVALVLIAPVLSVGWMTLSSGVAAAATQPVHWASSIAIHPSDGSDGGGSDGGGSDSSDSGGSDGAGTNRKDGGCDVGTGNGRCDGRPGIDNSSGSGGGTKPGEDGS